MHSGVANLYIVSLSKGKYRLSNMALDFISLVPAGDDPMAQVVLSKAAPEAVEKCNCMGDKHSKQCKNYVRKEDDMGDQITKDDLAPEVVEYIDGLEAEVETLTKSVEAKDADIESLTKALDEAETSSTVVKSEEEQHKALLAKADPAVRALIEKQQADLAAQQAIVKAERDARLDREFVSKAEAMPMLAEDKSDLGGLLRRLAEALPAEDVTKWDTILKSANEQIAQGNLFASYGSGGAETTISKSVDAAAQELMKSDPNLTLDMARAKVYENNPDLFAQAMTQEG